MDALSVIFSSLVESRDAKSFANDLVDLYDLPILLEKYIDCFSYDILF